MAVAFDGPNRLVTLTTSLAFSVHDDIYVAAVQWAALQGNMQYLAPMDSSGKAAISAGIYTDSIFRLANGWKLKPSGYSAGDQVTVSGTLITDDGTARTVPPTVGSAPVWVFTVSTNATLISSGATPDFWSTLLEGNYTAAQLVRGISAAVLGKLSGAAGAQVTIRDVNDTKSRITAAVDPSGNRTAVTYDLS